MMDFEPGFEFPELPELDSGFDLDDLDPEQKALVDRVTQAVLDRVDTEDDDRPRLVIPDRIRAQAELILRQRRAGPKAARPRFLVDATHRERGCCLWFCCHAA